MHLHLCRRLLLRPRPQQQPRYRHICRQIERGGIVCRSKVSVFVMRYVSGVSGHLKRTYKIQVCAPSCESGVHVMSLTWSIDAITLDVLSLAQATPLPLPSPHEPSIPQLRIHAHTARQRVHLRCYHLTHCPLFSLVELDLLCSSKKCRLRA